MGLPPSRGFGHVGRVFRVGDGASGRQPGMGSALRSAEAHATAAAAMGQVERSDLNPGDPGCLRDYRQHGVDPLFLASGTCLETGLMHTATLSARRRTGVAMIELLIASGVMIALVSLVLPTMRAISLAHRDGWEVRFAREELDNFLGHLVEIPLNQLEEMDVSETQVGQRIDQRLRDPVLRLSVDADGQAKRLHLILRWTNRFGQPAAPLELTTWVYPRQPSVSSVGESLEQES